MDEEEGESIRMKKSTSEKDNSKREEHTKVEIRHDKTKHDIEHSKHKHADESKSHKHDLQSKMLMQNEKDEYWKQHKESHTKKKHEVHTLTKKEVEEKTMKQKTLNGKEDNANTVQSEHNQISHSSKEKEHPKTVLAGDGDILSSKSQKVKELASKNSDEYDTDKFKHKKKHKKKLKELDEKLKHKVHHKEPKLISKKHDVKESQEKDSKSSVKVHLTELDQKMDRGPSHKSPKKKSSSESQQKVATSPLTKTTHSEEKLNRKHTSNENHDKKHIVKNEGSDSSRTLAQGEHKTVHMKSGSKVIHESKEMVKLEVKHSSTESKTDMDVTKKVKDHKIKTHKKNPSRYRTIFDSDDETDDSDVEENKPRLSARENVESKVTIPASEVKHAIDSGSLHKRKPDHKTQQGTKHIQTNKQNGTSTETKPKEENVDISVNTGTEVSKSDIGISQKDHQEKALKEVPKQHIKKEIDSVKQKERDIKVSKDQSKKTVDSSVKKSEPSNIVQEVSKSTDDMQSVPQDATKDTKKKRKITEGEDTTVKEEKKRKHSKQVEEMKEKTPKKLKLSEVPLDITKSKEVDVKIKKKHKEKVKQKLSMSECVQKRIERENKGSVKLFVTDQQAKHEGALNQHSQSISPWKAAEDPKGLHVTEKSDFDFDQKKQKVEKSMNMQIDKILKTSTKNSKNESSLNQFHSQETQKVHQVCTGLNVSHKVGNKGATDESDKEVISVKVKADEVFSSVDTKNQIKTTVPPKEESKVDVQEAKTKSPKESDFLQDVCELKEKEDFTKSDHVISNENKEHKIKSEKERKVKQKHSKKHKRSNSSDKNLEKVDSDVSRNPKKHQKISEDSKNFVALIKPEDKIEILNQFSDNETDIELVSDSLNQSNDSNHDFYQGVPFVSVYSKDPLNLESSESNQDFLDSLIPITNYQGPGTKPYSQVTVHEHILYCGPKHERQKSKDGVEKPISDSASIKKKSRRSSENDTENLRTKEVKLSESSDDNQHDSQSKDEKKSSMLDVNSKLIQDKKSKSDSQKVLSNDKKHVDTELKHKTDASSRMENRSQMEISNSDKEVKPRLKLSKSTDGVCETLKKRSSTSFSNKAKVKEVDLNLNMGVNENVLKELELVKKRKRKRLDSSRDTEVKPPKNRVTTNQDMSHPRLKKVNSSSNSIVTNTNVNKSESQTEFSKENFVTSISLQVSKEDTISQGSSASTKPIVTTTFTDENTTSEFPLQDDAGNKESTEVSVDNKLPKITEKIISNTQSTTAADRNSLRLNHTNFEPAHSEMNDNINHKIGQDIEMEEEGQPKSSAEMMKGSFQEEIKEPQNNDVSSIDDTYSLENENAVTNLLNMEEGEDPYEDYTQNTGFGTSSFNFNSSEFLLSQNTIQGDSYSDFTFSQINEKLEDKDSSINILQNAMDETSVDKDCKTDEHKPSEISIKTNTELALDKEVTEVSDKVSYIEDKDDTKSFILSPEKAGKPEAMIENEPESIKSPVIRNDDNDPASLQNLSENLLQESINNAPPEVPVEAAGGSNSSELKVWTDIQEATKGISQVAMEVNHQKTFQPNNFSEETLEKPTETNIDIESKKVVNSRFNYLENDEINSQGSDVKKEDEISLPILGSRQSESAAVVDQNTVYDQFSPQKQENHNQSDENSQNNLLENSSTGNIEIEQSSIKKITSFTQEKESELERTKTVMADTGYCNIKESVSLKSSSALENISPANMPSRNEVSEILTPERDQTVGNTNNNKNIALSSSSSSSQFADISVNTNLPLQNDEFSDLISPCKPCSSTFAHSYHDLDLIDTSDLIKTNSQDGNELLSSSTGSLALKEEVNLMNPSTSTSRRLSSDEDIISCILEMDNNDSSYPLREFVPTQSNSDPTFKSTFVSSISTSLSQVIENVKSAGQINNTGFLPDVPVSIIATSNDKSYSNSNIEQMTPGLQPSVVNTNRSNPVTCENSNTQESIIRNVTSTGSICSSQSVDMSQNRESLDLSLVEQPLSRHPSQESIPGYYSTSQSMYQHDSAFDTTSAAHFMNMVAQSMSNQANSTIENYQPLFVNTVATRLSSSDEKLYSPKHISAGEKLYSPRNSSSSTSGSKQQRKVDLEPCNIAGSIISSDIPVVPEPPPVPIVKEVKEEKPEIPKVVSVPISKQEASMKNKPTHFLSKYDNIKLPSRLRTWKQALDQRCTTVPKREINEKSLDEILKPFHLTDKYSDLVEKVCNKVFFVHQFSSSLKSILTS